MSGSSQGRGVLDPQGQEGVDKWKLCLSGNGAGKHGFNEHEHLRVDLAAIGTRELS